MTRGIPELSEHVDERRSDREAPALGAAVPHPATTPPRLATPGDVHTLQRTIGNHAVQRLLAPRPGPRVLSRTPSGDRIVSWLRGLQKDLLTKGPGVVVNPEGLDALISEIEGILGEAKAGRSDVMGKFRELMLGASAVRAGSKAQFGLVGGAGGDVAITTQPKAEEGDPKRFTVQSKYATGAAADVLKDNVQKAVYQLTGETSEVPIRGSQRVVDVVLEDEKYGDALVGDPNQVRAHVQAALDDEESAHREYPHLNLWKAVELIRVRSRGHEVHVRVDAAARKLVVTPVKAAKATEMDFPEVAVVPSLEAKGDDMSLLELLIKHENELVRDYEQTAKGRKEEKKESKGGGKAPPQKAPEVDVQQAAALLGRVDAEATQPEFGTELERFLHACPSVGERDETVIARLLKALAGGYPEPEQRDTAQALRGMLGKLGKGGRPITLASDLAKRADRWAAHEAAAAKAAEEKELRTAVAGDERYEKLEHERVLQTKMLKARAARWDPETVLDAFAHLQRVGKLEAAVAAAALADILAESPYGLPVCDLLASNLLVIERARNYARVLGQFKNEKERLTTVGPLMHALYMLKTEGQKAADLGLVLAFEYDAKSPGMWQVATQHFDMDIGWVHESQPLEIASLRQVKVVAGVSGVLDAMHASLEKGQLSLEGPERRLVIYCPSASVAEFATGEWKLEIARRLVKVNVKGIKLDIFFRDDAIAGLDLYECQALLAKPKEAVLS